MLNEIKTQLNQLKDKADELKEIIREKGGFKPIRLMGIIARPLPASRWLSNESEEKEDEIPEKKELEKIEKQISKLNGTINSRILQKFEEVKDSERFITIDYIKEIVNAIEVEAIVIVLLGKKQVSFSTSCSDRLYHLESANGVDSALYIGQKITA